MPEPLAEILIVDDDEGVGFMLSCAMSDQGYSPVRAPTAVAGLLRIAKHEPDTVLLDLALPDANGLEVLDQIKVKHPDVPVIVITGHGSNLLAVQAIDRGAYDYFTKPCDLDELRVVVRRAIEKRSLTRELNALKKSVNRQCRFDGIVGDSKVLQDILAVVARVADSNVNVLITGESGTGKELVARAIHENSSRRDKPFVGLNCAAIPHDLIEAELFGHERGAFTDAKQRRAGRFEMADGGTLFLDEVGDMSMPAQARLVRVLQEREFERVGGEETIRVDVRVVAATNKELRRGILDRLFREDLYYRLSVVTITLPALAQRRADIPLLVAHFVKKHTETGTGGKRAVTAEAMKTLVGYDWPGNIRELENCIQRALVLSDGSIEPAHLPPHILAVSARRSPAASRPGDLKTVLAEAEKRVIEEALAAYGGLPAQAAENLGISERTLWYKLKRHGIRLGAYQPSAE